MEKQRIKSRGESLIELYKGIQKESKEWRDEKIREIRKADSDGSLRSKKLYLYYTQLERDMYTGERIELDQLLHDNIYDIDHIYPKHFVKDDNISNNLVLVNKEANNHIKQDVFPIEESIRHNPKVIELWKELYAYGLINDEKYRRLTRSIGFTEEERADFIARQMVETYQGTKGVANLLKQLLPDSTIVYAKAANVSKFRKDNGFIKSRLVNDFHHAQDAYLNIVVGNVYFVKFTQNPLNYIKKEWINEAEDYHLDKMFDKDVKRGNEVAWIAKKKRREREP